MSLATPPKVRKLQRTLYAKAKREPSFRFYSLYDKMHRPDVLAFAYARCKANGGAPGVDGQTFEDIESYGLDRWMGELAETLRTKRYRPQPVRRVYIPKPGQPKRQRPLGIPTITDRVAQTAAVLVLEPIFEADLQPEQYAYRPKRSALDAVRQVYALTDSGHREVVDADLSEYFETVPHAELMRSVARRVSDGAVLRLIKMWLRMPVEEPDRRGRHRRQARARKEKRGIPQGAPVSPVLANLYMRRFVLGWKQLGHEQRLDAHIVNFADDLVICCRGTADEAMAEMKRMMAQLRLTVNEQKTCVCRLKHGSFDFLGYTFGRCYSRRTGVDYLGARPAKRQVKRLHTALRERTGRHRTNLPVQMVVAELNQLLVGWANYFSLRLGPLSQTYAAVDAQARWRLRRWLNRKHKQSGNGGFRYPDQYLHGTLGLVELRCRRDGSSKASA